MNEMKLQLELSAIYGYALSYNRFPAIERILLDTPYEVTGDLVLTLTAKPAFFQSKIIPIHTLTKGGHFAICAPQLTYHADYLAYLEENVPAVVIASLTQNGKEIASAKHPITLLPANVWSGSEIMPELLATLISPAQEEIQKTVDQVCAELSPRDIFRHRDYSDHSPKAILTMMETLYHTLRSLRLSYAMHTPDANKKGVSLCYPEAVLQYRKGNSLELALLFASLLEALGMHPVLALFKQQTIVGCHLRKTAFPSSAFHTYHTLFTRDGKNGKEGAVCFLDMATLAYGTSFSFEEAIKSTYSVMRENAADFVVAIDIYRARHNGISSLPDRVLSGDNRIFANIDAALDKMPGYDDLAARSIGDVYDRASALFRNRIITQDDDILLSTHENGNGLQLIDIDPTVIVSKLMQAGGVDIAPSPFRFSGQDRDVADLCLIGEHLASSIPPEEDDPVLTSFLEKKSLQKYLSRLSDMADRRADECGYTGLCVGMGLIRYTETHSDDISYAPAILYPVRLLTNTEDKGYRLVSTGEAPLYHEALFEKLHRIFGIRPDGLPSLAGRGFAALIPGVLRQIKSAYSLCSGVTLCSGSCLGIFACDNAHLLSLLSPHTLRSNPLSSALVSQKYPMDEEPIFRTPTSALLPMDDKQYAAFHTALAHTISLTEGQSGSGRSRVAENLMFHLLENGKRVLYVASSQSSVQNMFKRLKANGLEEAAVAYGASAPILAPAFPTASLTLPPPESSLPVLMAQIAHCKNEIDSYYAALKKVGLFGFSFTRALQQFERYRDADAVPFTPLELTGLTKDEIALRFDTAATLFAAGHACGEPHNHILRGVTVHDLSPVEMEEATLLTAELPALYQQFIKQITALASAVKVDVPQTSDAIATLWESARIFAAAPMGMVKKLLVSDLFEESSPTEILKSAASAMDIREHLDSLFADGAFSLPVEEMINDLQNAQNLSFFKKKTIRTATLHRLNEYTKNGYTCKLSELEDILIQFSLYRTRLNAAGDIFAKLSSLFGFADWALDTLPAGTIRQMAAASEVCDSLRNRFAAKDLNDLADSLPESTQTVAEILREAESAYSLWSHSFRSWASLLKIALPSGLTVEGAPFSLLAETVDTIKRGIDRLPAWCHYLAVKQTALQNGLEKVVAMYESKPLTSENMEASFVKGFFDAACRSILLTEDVLRTFNPAVFAAKIAHLEKLEETFRKQALETFLTSHTNLCNAYYTDHLRNAPQYARCLENNECLNVGRLDSLLPEAADVRFPCVLSCTAPILRKMRERPGFAAFDCVIFDEAENIPFDHALAIIGCARQIAVFASPALGSRTSHRFIAESTPLCSTNREDMDSLYEVIGNNCPNKTVLTQGYAAPGLADIFASLTTRKPIHPTMPNASPVRFDDAVEVTVIDENITDSFNPEDAEAIGIIQTLTALSEQTPVPSVGIITGNHEQAKRIERYLSAFLSRDASLAKRLAESQEALYITPLSDATDRPRDYILFSPAITLSKQDASIPTAATFAIPDCRARLDAAVGSAKKKMHVVCAFSPAVVSKKSTLDDSYNALCDFFLALNTKTIYTPLPSTVTSRSEETVCQTICTRLHAEGYLTVYPMSESIDIAVSMPDAPDTYLLGITLDQTALHAAKDTSARECILPRHQKAHGWQIHRILAPAWYADREACLKEIFSKLP